MFMYIHTMVCDWAQTRLNFIWDCRLVCVCLVDVWYNLDEDFSSTPHDKLSGNNGSHMFPGSILDHTGIADSLIASDDYMTQPSSTLQPSLLHEMSTAPVASSAQKDGSQAKSLFVCDFCDASFTFESSMYRHRNSVHLNRNLHVCGICGKGITRKENFEDHMNMHNNIKAHRCPQCGQGFTFKNKLRHHVRTQH